MFEADNGLGFSAAPWSTALNALFLRRNEIVFSPLWSKWSLPRALLRMLKRHPSRNCTWEWGRVWLDTVEGENRNVHIIVITYLTVMQAPHSPPQYNFLYPGLVQDVKVDSVFTLAVTLRLVSLGFLSHEDLNLFCSHADLHIHTFTLVCANVDTQTHTRCYFRL